MAKSLKIVLDFLSYTGKLSNDPVNSIKNNTSVSEPTVSEVCRLQKDVPDGTSDLVITLPDANSDYILVYVNEEISIKLNGSGDALTLKPKATGVATPVFFMKGDITGLTVSNSSGKTAEVDFILVNL